MNVPKILSTLVRMLLAAGSVWFSLAADRPGAGELWRYQLIQESTYLDDCPPCGRPSILRPLRGSFFLTPATSNPLFDRYDLKEVRLNVGGEGESGIQLEGSGQLEVGGEVALVHRLTLRLNVRAPGRPEETVDFESELQPGKPDWPRLALSVQEVNPSLVRVLHLTLESMPIRDLWFSTAHGFTAGLPGPAPIPRYSADLLSDQGRVTVSRETVIQALGLPSPADEFNVDAFDVAPEGEVQLSLAGDVNSSVLGPLHHGDLVGIPARLIKPYFEFTAAIGPQPVAPDLGLDAVQLQADGSWLFSVRDPVFSEKLGFVVGPGDLMSTSGQRIRSNQELLKEFAPLDPKRDYGLDALYVWPSGEIWFSTEESVELDGSRYLQDGDLLSDRGRVVLGNLELLQNFGPMEDAANFGLDGLVIVTDATEPVAKSPLLTVDLPAGEIVLKWSGLGRFFQVERATDLAEGGFEPASPIMVEHEFRRPASGTSEFFRVRQW